MSVCIKVAIRCRPCSSCTDPKTNKRIPKEEMKMGVQMEQTAEEEGEVNVINSTYTKTRFGYTWSWWTCNNYDRYLREEDQPTADSMKYIGQDAVYHATGTKVMGDLMEGNAVVLFAYGLSGSGKTFTVFGPDAADSPDAWFKHQEPHPLWGLYPHLAYDLFAKRGDGWKFEMKYFQNVVDIVRDLMSATAEERNYKQGMKKDKDGFTDINWCSSSVLKDWPHLCEQFQLSNAKKAISPTQFNHQSTRGHCIMTLEIKMPKPDGLGSQTSRIYVCDLAGTEPAGDIYAADYKKNEHGEYVLQGQNKDQRKTKELQDQGKKINLSLSEMSQFFMKMAEAIKKKKLKAGESIPGCNTNFLCKYLKDTMLQARTYLFCAIRPEAFYHPYTYSTLKFADDASVIKLDPKKATGVMTAKERELMKQIEELKKGGGGGMSAEDMAAALAEQRAALLKEMEGNDDNQAKQDAALKQQAEDYARMGISLTHFEKETASPYFVNLDEDSFRSNRFMYLLSREVTVFGPGGDIKPMALTIVKDHCTVENKLHPATSITPEFQGCTMVGGAGEVVHNGKKVEKGARVALKSYDRIVMGGELLLYHKPDETPAEEPPTASAAIQEYQEFLQEKEGEKDKLFKAQMAEFEKQKEEWFKKAQDQQLSEEEEKAQRDLMEKEEHARAMAAVDREILELLPKTKELKQIVGLLDRSMLSFDVTLQRSEDGGEKGIPKVKVKVINSQTTEDIVIDPFEFMKAYSLIKDEMSRLSMAIDNEREYEFKEHNDPLNALFDNTFQLGTVTLFPEYMLYGLATAPDETQQDIKNISAPYNNVGKLEVIWVPLEGADAEEDPDYMPEIEEIEELIGQSWTYKVKIMQAIALPLITDMCYIQYNFNGELFTTETVEQGSSNPEFTYECVHHVESVTQEFLDYLSMPFEVDIFCSPDVKLPKAKVGTSNPVVVQSIKSGVPGGSSGGSSGGGGGGGSEGSELEQLKKQVNDLTVENTDLKQKLEKAHAQIAELGGGSKLKDGLESAKIMDAELNA